MTDRFNHFLAQPLTTLEIEKLIKQLRNDCSSEHDNIPGNLINLVAECLSHH